MPDSAAAWTGGWAAERLLKHHEVKSVEVLSPQTLRITRVRARPFVAGTLGSSRVEAREVEELLSESHDIEFVANIPSESFWTGDAISLARQRGVGWGALRDLLSAVSDEDPRLHVNRDMEFLENGLDQHTGVTKVERVHDRKFVISRHGLGDVIAVLLEEYTITADHVRKAHARYGSFDALVHTNPNGGTTDGAIRVAEALGASVYTWGQFLGRLNRR